MRTIDADALKKTLKGLFFPGQLHHHFDAEKCAYNGALNDVMERILNAPSIEAVPVVHAKWIPSSVDPADPYFRCSNCRHGRDTIYFQGDEYNFCPNCGAKMDGEIDA